MPSRIADKPQARPFALVLIMFIPLVIRKLNAAVVHLVGGRFSLVDEADWQLVDGRRWCCTTNSRGRKRKKYYACAIGGVGDSKPVILMHRLLMGLDGPPVDHVHGNTLDNRRSELRHCTQQQNSANRPKRNTSWPYKGIRPKKRSWTAVIGFNYKRVWLGQFATAEEAARAYDAAAVSFFGEFAVTNFPVTDADVAAHHQRMNSPAFRRKQLRAKSKYLGVAWDKSRNRWLASSRKKYLGRFDGEQEAAIAYDRFAIATDGSRARTNFPKAHYGMPDEPLGAPDESAAKDVPQSVPVRKPQKFTPLTISSLGAAVIHLTRGYHSLIDIESWDQFSSTNWCSAMSRGGKVYAIGWVREVGYLMLHRLVMGTPDDRVDHIHHRTLDNRRSQLRIASTLQNNANRRKPRFANCSSLFKGVKWIKSRNCWHVHIGVRGKNEFLGSFSKEIDAARQYDAAAQKHYGEFACLNFPGEHHQLVPARLKGVSRACTSKFRGVYRYRQGRWEAKFRSKHIGMFAAENEAARAYDHAAIAAYGDKAKLNFPSLGQLRNI